MTELVADSLIRVEQLPIITEQLKDAKAYVERITNEAVALVCNEDTYKDVKQTRAELSKAFAALEACRKQAKKSVMEPYEKLEAVYRECVAEPFKAADAALKGKISAVEETIKGRAEEYAREYFAELAASEHLADWLTYERMGLAISMTDAQQKTHKSIQGKVSAFVIRISEDVHAIAEMADAEEIMVEYKQTLDLPTAFTAVKYRHDKLREEQERREKYRAAQEAEQAAAAKVEAVAPVVMAPPTEEAPEPQQQPEKLLTITFTATGTRAQLIAVREFMKKEGIKYE